MQPEALVVIPSRLGSTRLPHKPLADIHGDPMIIHVWRRACEAAVGPVVVACDHPDIYEAIDSRGGKALMTSAHHSTGSDRVAEAMETLDPEGLYPWVINLQGDMPLFPPSVLSQLLTPFCETTDIEITTCVVPFPPGDPRMQSPHTVKAVVNQTHPWGGYCPHFTRQPIPTPYYHVGLYGFRRHTLKTFVSLPPSARETQESLEQLRALDAGMKIGAIILKNAHFISIDTADDLIHARNQMA